MPLSSSSSSPSPSSSPHQHGRGEGHSIRTTREHTAEPRERRGRHLTARSSTYSYYSRIILVWLLNTFIGVEGRNDSIGSNWYGNITDKIPTKSGTDLELLYYYNNYYYIPAKLCPYEEYIVNNTQENTECKDLKARLHDMLTFVLLNLSSPILLLNLSNVGFIYVWR